MNSLARLRNKSLIFIVSVDSEGEVDVMRKEIEKMRLNGELDGVIREVRLGGG